MGHFQTFSYIKKQTKQTAEQKKTITTQQHTYTNPLQYITKIYSELEDLLFFNE
jgi:ABC-type metal ion transport system substrate-binding protein